MNAQQFLARLVGRAANHAHHIRCSFCGRGRDEVEHLVSGPGVYICGQCVDHAARIVNESRAARPD